MEMLVDIHFILQKYLKEIKIPLCTIFIDNN